MEIVEKRKRGRPPLVAKVHEKTLDELIGEEVGKRLPGSIVSQWNVCRALGLSGYARTVELRLADLCRAGKLTPWRWDTYLKP